MLRSGKKPERKCILRSFDTAEMGIPTTPIGLHLRWYMEQNTSAEHSNDFRCTVRHQKQACSRHRKNRDPAEIMDPNP